MTTIEEETTMDEFFNFDDAAHPLAQHDFDFGNLEAGAYDVDLALNQVENDGEAFSALQHFSTAEPHGFDLQTSMPDTTTMGPADFLDFQRWIEGSNVPSKPCRYCSQMRIDCKTIKEGIRKGSCTSCVALAKTCSLSVPNLQSINDDEEIDLNVNGNDDYGLRDWSELTQAPAPPQDYVDWNMEDLILPSDAPLVSPRQQDSFHSSRPNSNPISVKSSDENIHATSGNGPKIGARFSREAIKVLRNWLSTHHSHPYPTDEEKDTLRRQTGLDKTQITNWLANARRRGKARPQRSTSPHPNNYSMTIDIPRRATPGLENMNPLERWKHSPPENEPAAITAIAKAVTSSTYSSGLDSPLSYGHSQTDDGSNRSLCNVSSTSSLGTSHSSGNSFASAFSHKSRGSFGSFSSFGQRGRRRRRRPAPNPVKSSTMTAPARTYQCTFCTETFKTKHDWQRHEKSLHLSLERWICCPNGPQQYCADYGHNRCVFCGLPNPSEEHSEQHNFSSCAERALEERTFYRKDHLRQHLTLVHDVKFQSFSMETWKVVTPEIRSRCGFCGIVLDTWSIRTDHLAEHFKGGNSMADWKGDWGFEPEILDIVENGMPPYLIHDERNSMNPYEASKESAEEEKTLEDLVKIGLVEYLHDVLLRGGVPTDEDLLREARNIIRKADSFTVGGTLPQVSWFRDLIMIYGSAEQSDCPERSLSDAPDSNLSSWKQRLDRITQLAPHDTTNLHAISDPKERALMTWVKSRQMLGLTPLDRELQVECIKILDDVETTSNFKAKGAAGWFKYLVRSETCWLRDFRRRANLPRSSEMASEEIRCKDDKSIDHSIHNFARLENELRDWCRFQMTLGNPPSDGDIQRQARLIVYKSDDPWNQTAADDPATLHLSKRQLGLAPKEAVHAELHTISEAEGNSPQSPKSLHWDLEFTGIGLTNANGGQSSATSSFCPPINQPLHTLVQNQPSTNTNPVQPLKFFLNDANCYGRLVRELSRFVTSCMSPNNPMQHAPTDAEIQNQARWIIYDDDDPWNQTAADNAEWLLRFKRDVGLAPQQDGPGLPLNINSWREAEGGCGFSPPYLCPQNEPAAAYAQDVPVTMKHKTYNIKASTAEKFVKSVSKRFEKPATIFCSREMETHLTKYAKAEMARGITPTDEALRAEARNVLGIERTSADEPALLQKFKVMVGISRHVSPLATTSIPETIDNDLLAAFDDEIGEMDLNGIEIPGSISPILDGIPAEVDAISSPSSSTSLPRLNTSPQSKTKGPGLAQDYAELYMVNAATASPLGRHATTLRASKAGHSWPNTISPTSSSPTQPRQGRSPLASPTSYHNEEYLCDEELVERFEAEERARGVLTEQEIESESSRMVNRFMERKWEREGVRDVVLASGWVRRLEGLGNVHPHDTGVRRRCEGLEEVDEDGEEDVGSKEVEL